jgi:hypothetical protein
LINEVLKALGLLAKGVKDFHKLDDGHGAEGRAATKVSSSPRAVYKTSDDVITAELPNPGALPDSSSRRVCDLKCIPAGQYLPEVRPRSGLSIQLRWALWKLSAVDAKRLITSHPARLLMTKSDIKSQWVQREFAFIQHGAMS